MTIGMEYGKIQDEKKTPVPKPVVPTPLVIVAPEAGLHVTVLDPSRRSAVVGGM
jgi:hypothetical protein